MPASSLTFLAELINASIRHLNFLFIDIRFTQTSVITIISIFLTIADNQIDGQNNESEVNAIRYPVQNAVQISKRIYRYYKLSVCMWVDTKMLVGDILAIFCLFFMLIVLKSGVRHCLTIAIMCIGHCTSCSIAVDGGSMCEMCRRYLGSHLYSDGDGSICNACIKKSTQRNGATS